MTTSCSRYWAAVMAVSFFCGGDFFSSSTTFYILGAGNSTVPSSSASQLLPITPLTGLTVLIGMVTYTLGFLVGVLLTSFVESFITVSVLFFTFV